MRCRTDEPLLVRRKHERLLLVGLWIRPVLVFLSIQFFLASPVSFGGLRSFSYVLRSGVGWLPSVRRPARILWT